MNIRNFFFFSIPLVLIGLMIFIIYYQFAFFYYHESDRYLTHYLGDRPIIQKIFDFRNHDIGIYRPRELGNVFNMFDAYVLLLFAAVGFPHFVSVTHIVAMLFVASVPLWIIRRRRAELQEWLAAMLLGLLFLLSPVPLLGSYYLRVSKSINAVFFMLIFLLLYTTESKLGWRRLLIIGFFVVCLGLTDETGMISILVLGFYGLARLIFTKFSRNAALLLFTIGSGIGLIALYRSVISPWIVKESLGLDVYLWQGKQVSSEWYRLFPSGFQLFINYCSGLFGGYGNFFMIPMGFVLFSGIAWLVISHAKRKKLSLGNQQLINTALYTLWPSGQGGRSPLAWFDTVK